MTKGNALKHSERVNTLRSIATVAGDMETHIEEALTVMSVAEQKYGGDELSGVFALIESKILDIRGAQEQIAILASRSDVVKKTEGRQS